MIIFFSAGPASTYYIELFLKAYILFWFFCCKLSALYVALWPVTLLC